MSSDPKIIREIEASSKLLNFELKDISKELHGVIQDFTQLKGNLKKSAFYASEFDKFLSRAIPSMTSMEKSSSQMFATHKELQSLNEKMANAFSDQQKFADILNDKKEKSLRLERAIDRIGKNTALSAAQQATAIGNLRNQQARLNVATAEKQLSDHIVNNELKVKDIGEKILNKRLQMAALNKDELRRQAGDRAKDGLINKFGGALFSKLKDSDLSKSLGIDSFVAGMRTGPLIALAAVVKLIEVGYENFLKLDKAGTDVRKKFGLLRGEANAFEKNIKRTAIEMSHLGVSFDDVARATESIGFMFTTMVADNRDLVKNMSVLSAQLGITADESAKFLKTMASVGKTTAHSQVSMLGFAREMSKAAGIPLGSVMKDIAAATDDVRIFTKLVGNNLISATIQARAMGTSLDKIARTGKAMLDFQTSITDEMEVSVLLGKNVNFQRARELSYSGKLIEASREIVNIANKLDFTAMDPFQAEAFAKAAGKSVQELQEMMQIEKEREWILTSGTAAQRQQLQMFEDMKNASSDTSKSIGEQATMRLQQQANQEKINALQNKFNALMMQLVDPVIMIVDPLLSIAGAILSAIKPVFKLIGLLIKVGTPLVWIARIVSKIEDKFAGMGDSLKYIISPFNAVIDVASRFLEVIDFGLDSVFDTIGNKLTPVRDAFVKIGEMANNAVAKILKPFQTAWDWIDSHFIGHSPSLIGEGILNGITSIGPMLLASLITPFTSGFKIISKLFESTPLAEKLNIESPGIEIGSSNKSDSSNKRDESIAEMVRTNREVSAKLTTLIDLMKAGNIAVNIDGSKASHLLARAKTERGALGAI